MRVPHGQWRRGEGRSLRSLRARELQSCFAIGSLALELSSMTAKFDACPTNLQVEVVLENP